MKRNKNLVTLSHDHYHGLNLANLIKKGAPVFNKLPNDIPGKLEYTLLMFDNDINKHFIDEEEILFPTVMGKDSETDILIKEILDEHAVMRNIVSSLKSGEDIENNLNLLGEMLLQHIRREERIVFGKIEELLSEEELENIRVKIDSARKG